MTSDTQAKQHLGLWQPSKHDQAGELAKALTEWRLRVQEEYVPIKFALACADGSKIEKPGALLPPRLSALARLAC